MYKKLIDVLNKMVSIERRSGNLFELGEVLNITVNQIPYFRLKNMVESMNKWNESSLKLSDGYVVSDLLDLLYNKKIENLTESEFDRSFLYPVNIICQLIDFFYLIQKNKKRFSKLRLINNKVRIILEKNERYSICKIYTNIHLDDHWFVKKKNEIWNIVHQYTNSINLHSPFVEVKRLEHEKKCLVLIKFDMNKYYEEEEKVLGTIREKLGTGNNAEFKKNKFSHTLSFAAGDKFIKLVDSRISACKMNTLYGEFNILSRFKDLNGFPDVKEYRKIGCYEMIVSDNISGKTLDLYLSENSNDIEVVLLFKLFDLVRKLRQNYIVHRDLKHSNILITLSNDVYVIDFDQASFTSDIYNRSDSKISKYSISSPCFTLFDTFKKIKKVREKIEIIQTMIGKVWKDAAKSNSNAPCKDIAYYTYSFGDVDYVGERDFFERWVLLEKNNISLKDKVVVELGCNIGLFGTYSSIYGAKHVMCFDHDNEIIECAKELANIVGLNNMKHEVRDLHEIGAFTDINKIDFMFALSVHYWLEDTTEFDRLMDLTVEVLYEGHEQYDIEYKRLREWGFTEIRVIGTTDRLRTVFYAKK